MGKNIFKFLLSKKYCLPKPVPVHGATLTLQEKITRSRRPFPTSGDICLPLSTFAHSLDPCQARHIVGPNLDMVFQNIFGKIIILKKKHTKNNNNKKTKKKQTKKTATNPTPMAQKQQHNKTHTNRRQK